jgi:hypothetical protein
MPLQAVPMYLTYSGLDSIATVPFDAPAQQTAMFPRLFTKMIGCNPLHLRVCWCAGIIYGFCRQWVIC